MLRNGPKIMIATVAAVGALGVGVAVAADNGSCPYGNTPGSAQAAQPAARPANGAQQRLRERDGTGPRHAQQMKDREARQHGKGAHRGEGNRGETCPYRG